MEKKLKLKGGWGICLHVCMHVYLCILYIDSSKCYLYTLFGMFYQLIDLGERRGGLQKKFVSIFYICSF